MKFLKYALIILFSVGLMSCGSSSDDDVDDTAPTVNITSPTATSEVNSGDDFTVSFTADDNVELKSYRVQIAINSTTKSIDTFTFDSKSNLTDADGNSLPDFNITGEPETISFSVATDLGDNTVAEEGMYKVTVTVTDSSNNTGTAEVIFEIKVN